ncbi:MAG: UbiA family prenyltransferase [Planctomycetes bacterium]|nr:UbiA family prenyltransferase [Planctomycetota bacterium]
MSSAPALLRLVRWPGAVTAAGNTAACFLLAHRPGSPGGTSAAVGAIGGAALVYAGGVVLNDVADAERDRTLHPSRPIPAGLVDRASALKFGLALLAAGVASTAFLANPAAAAVAAACTRSPCSPTRQCSRGSARSKTGPTAGGFPARSPWRWPSSQPCRGPSSRRARGPSRPGYPSSSSPRR